MLKASWALVIAISGFVIRCGHREVTRLPAGDAPAPAIPVGWATHDHEAAQCSVALPKSWRTRRQMQEEQADAMATAMREGGVDVSGIEFGLEDDLGPTGRMPGTLSVPSTAFEPGEVEALVVHLRGIVGEVSFPTRLVVQHDHVGGGTSLASEADKAKGKFPGFVSTERVRLAIGEAEKVTHRVKSRDGEIGTVVTYLVVDNEDVWTLRFQTEQDASVVTNVCDEVVGTFRPRRS